MVSTVTSTCKECGKYVPGNKNFCDRSCAATHTNKNREIEKICEVCNTKFFATAGNAKYCSDECSDKTPGSNGYRRGTSPSKEWKRMKRKVDRSVCYRCGWNQTTCDLAHIKARSDGGSNKPENLIVLCPNCHRLADKTEKIDIEDLPTVYDREDQWK